MKVARPARKVREADRKVATAESIGRELQPFFASGEFEAASGSMPVQQHSRRQDRQPRSQGSSGGRWEGDVSIAVRKFNSDGYFEEAVQVSSTGRQASPAVAAPTPPGGSARRKPREADRTPATAQSIGRPLQPYFAEGGADDVGAMLGTSPPTRLPTRPRQTMSAGRRPREADRKAATAASVGRDLVKFFPDGDPGAGVPPAGEPHGNRPRSSSDAETIAVRKWNAEGYFETARVMAVPATRHRASAPAPTGTGGVSMTPEQLFSMARGMRTPPDALAPASAPAVATPPPLPTRSSGSKMLLTPSQLLRAKAAPATARKAKPTTPPVEIARVHPPSDGLVAPSALHGELSATGGINLDDVMNSVMHLQREQQAQQGQHMFNHSSSDPHGGAARHSSGGRRTPDQSYGQRKPPSSGRKSKNKKGKGGKGNNGKSYASAVAAPQRTPQKAKAGKGGKGAKAGKSSTPTSFAWSSFQVAPDPSALPMPSFEPMSPSTLSHVRSSPPQAHAAPAPAQQHSHKPQGNPPASKKQVQRRGTPQAKQQAKQHAKQPAPRSKRNNRGKGKGKGKAAAASS